ncbi:MAG TPA: zinc-dependent metalloprotease [Jatrophihabitantaceae bacterium]
MSGNLPFGFGASDPNQPGGTGGSDDPNDLAGKIPLFAELQKLLSWSGGPVNWDLARQVAISGLAGEHRSVDAADRAAGAEALKLADLWLNDVTDLPSGITAIESWTRVDWIEKTLPVWSKLCDPLASRVVAAMGASLPEEMQAMGASAGPMAGVMNQVGGLMFGAQVGQGLAGLAHEVVSATDVGLPLGPAGTAALLPENVAAFGDGLERPVDEVRLYLALREAAHQRLFGHVPWLRQRLLDTVDAYARGITVDTSAIERAMGEIDPTNPESLQNALSGGLFEPQETPEQLTALRRLETLLALIEGWVDAVVYAAAGERMPGAAALREASRRRRATGGPAEQTFSTLVGLELRPRRLREAAALWWAVTEKHGVSGRDGVWAHPDLLPDADDLDDPLGFAEKLGADDVPELGEGTD